jgi:hypothetical protein
VELASEGEVARAEGPEPGLAGAVAAVVVVVPAPGAAAALAAELGAAAAAPRGSGATVAAMRVGSVLAELDAETAPE